jgi:FkbM family methyltransferase
MIDKRYFNFWNKNYEFTWVESDVECFSIISEDWHRYHNKIFGYARKHDVVLQAGGNCGLYPFLHSLVFKNVITFEPDPMNFYCLSENCKNNKIIKFNAALNDKCEFIKIGIRDKQNVGMHKVGSGGVKVFSMPVDNLGLEELDLLHLDLEGHEFHAFLGAKKTIWNCKPTVIVEMTENKEEIYNFFKELDYVEVDRFGMHDVVYQPKHIQKN